MISSILGQCFRAGILATAAMTWLAVFGAITSVDARSRCRPPLCSDFQERFQDWQTPRFSELPAGSPCQIETVADTPRLIIRFGSVDAMPRGGVRIGVTPRSDTDIDLLPMTISIAASGPETPVSLRVDRRNALPLQITGTDAGERIATLVLALNSPEERSFVQAFRKGAQIAALSASGKNVTVWSLNGSSRAMDWIMQCK